MPFFIAYINADLTLGAAIKIHYRLTSGRASSGKNNLKIHFEDFDYFTSSELRFLSSLNHKMRPLTPHEIASDKLELSREITERRKICKSHAEYLLKAIAYWELRFESKYEEWQNQGRAASEGRHLRNQLKKGEITPEEAASGVMFKEDRCESGFSQERPEEESESDFTDDGDDDWIE